MWQGREYVSGRFWGYKSEAGHSWSTQWTFTCSKSKTEMSEIYLKLIIKTNFTQFSCVSINDFEEVNGSWLPQTSLQNFKKFTGKHSVFLKL